MSALRILMLCVSAALICASLRSAHPQLATAVALAAGVAALMLSVEDLGRFAGAVRSLEGFAREGGVDQIHLLKICGVAMIAEFASDICRDADEAALAHRIDAGVKLGIVAAALPLAAELMERISALLV